MTLDYRLQWKLVENIVNGKTYREIQKEMKISFSTISKYYKKYSKIDIQNAKINFIGDLLNLEHISGVHYTTFIDMIKEKLDLIKKEYDKF